MRVIIEIGNIIFALLVLHDFIIIIFVDIILS